MRNSRFQVESGVLLVLWGTVPLYPVYKPTRSEPWHMPEDRDEVGLLGFDAELAGVIVQGANILVEIVGNPTRAPCMEELEYMNTGIGEEIREVLAELIDAGLVVERTSMSGDPRTFYEVPSAVRNRFDAAGLFPGDAWRRQYAAVSKTERIKELEDLPRPSTPEDA